MLGAILTLVTAQPDWLVHPAQYIASAHLGNRLVPEKYKALGAEGGSVVLENGLVRREIVLFPNATCISLQNMVTGEELIRAVKPEASLTLDGKELAVGGLLGQPDLAFFQPKWLQTMTADPAALEFRGVTFGETKAPFPYKPSGHFTRREWPPKGKSAVLEFTGNDLKVQVHYEIYDGIPLIGKWLTITNTGAGGHTVDAYRSEILGLIEGESAVGVQAKWRLPNVTVFTDYAFGGDNEADAQPAIQWLADPHYETIVNYERVQPVDFVSSPRIGPGIELAPGQSLTTHRTYVPAQDSTLDRERMGLAMRRAYRKLAPWALENPLMLHLTSVNPEVVHRAMDQAAECGFELVIFSFGSGLEMEDVSPVNLATFKAYADYAHAKGLMVGGYSLLASRHIDDATDVINPKTGKRFRRRDLRLLAMPRK